jgi:hypothetical protein
MIVLLPVADLGVLELLNDVAANLVASVVEQINSIPLLSPTADASNGAAVLW